MNHPTLLELDSTPDASTRLASETADTLSLMRDKRKLSRLALLADRLSKTEHAVERARLAAEIRDLADALVASSIRDANETGLTWREIGAELGVPFQTLYRRYGASR